MTTNNTPPNALENDLPEDGELTLEELEQIIGGQADPSLNLTVENKFIGDVPMVQAATDSAYSSFLGANGTSNNEAARQHIHVLNVTSHFP
jgi:hypothetical protein